MNKLLFLAAIIAAQLTAGALAAAGETLTVAGFFLYRGRRALFASQINRRIVGMTMLTLISGFVFRAVLAVSGLDFLQTLPLEFVLYAAGIALMSLATHPRIALAALPVLLGAIAMVLSPDLVTEIAGATVFAALATMAAVWQRDVAPFRAGQALEGRFARAGGFILTGIG